MERVFSPERKKSMCKIEKEEQSDCGSRVVTAGRRCGGYLHYFWDRIPNIHPKGRWVHLDSSFLVKKAESNGGNRKHVTVRASRRQRGLQQIPSPINPLLAARLTPQRFCNLPQYCQ